MGVFMTLGTEDDNGAPTSSAAESDDAVAQSDDNAPSSSATDENRDSMSVVRDVLAAKDEEAEADSSSAEVETEEPEPPAEPDNENYSDVPFNKHPRFRELLARAKSNEADATRYRNVDGYLRENDLDAQEAFEALDILARVKRGDPTAWEVLRPFAERAALASGALLSPEMQARVARGELTPASAIELSRAQAQATGLESQRQMELRRAQEYAAQMQARSVQDAAVGWEQERRARDPSFDTKIDPMVREVAYLQISEGKPDTPQGVRDQLERAYRAVNAALRPAQPASPPRQKPAVKPVVGGQATAARDPSSMTSREIIRSIMNKGRPG